MMDRVIIIRHCNCLKGTTNRVRDMLVAEGFDVRMKVVLRPLTLQVISGERVIWSFSAWNRQVPDQKTLAGMILAPAKG